MKNEETGRRTTRGAERKAKGKIVIDREACKGCTYCLMACPKGCITIEENFNAMRYFPAHFEAPEKCAGCAMCAHVCPEIAIEVWREEKD